MKIRLYELPSEYVREEYNGWLDWESAYTEYVVETGETVHCGMETFTWDTWDDRMTSTPFVWIRDESGKETFIGLFYFPKGAAKAMEFFIRAKYPKTDIVEFMNVSAHLEKMYGDYKEEE